MEAEISIPDSSWEKLSPHYNEFDSHWLAAVSDTNRDVGFRRHPRDFAEYLQNLLTTVAELCLREKCSVRQVNMTISLAFLAPNLVKAAVEGRLPRGVGIERLRDPPTEWSWQFEALGLNPE